MRKFSFFASTALVFAAVAPSQFTCPLGQPLTSANQGNVGGGIYFNMTVTSTITWNSIQYVASDTTPIGNSSFELYVGPATWVGNVLANPGPWKLVGQSVPVAITATLVDTPVLGVLQPAGANPGTITFGPGNYGIALRAVGHSWGYQNGTFTFPAPGGEFSITAGGASNAFLTGPTFTPRTINGNIDYAVGGTPMPYAAAVAFGNGCYDFKQSFYEIMGNTATNQDLSNTSFRLTLDTGNNRYNVTAGAVPVNTAAVVSAPLVFGNDDADVQVTLGGAPMLWPDSTGTIATSPIDPITNMPICEVNANGYINFVPGSNNPPLANPTVANFLTGGARFGNHIDLDPITGGTVNFDFTGTEYLFTWQNVPLFAVLNTPNTLQIAYDTATGDLELRYGTMSVACGGPCHADRLHAGRRRPGPGLDRPQRVVPVLDGRLRPGPAGAVGQRDAGHRHVGHHLGQQHRPGHPRRADRFGQSADPAAAGAQPDVPEHAGLLPERRHARRDRRLRRPARHQHPEQRRARRRVARLPGCLDRQQHRRLEPDLAGRQHVPRRHDDVERPAAERRSVLIV
jgi:hypothetical protein